MYALAYGEFDSWTRWGMFCETMPFFLRIVVQAFGCYLLCTLVAETVKFHTFGLLLFVLLFGLLATNFTVLGAYGPAHVGMQVGILAWPALAVPLLVKVGVLHVRTAGRHAPD